MNFYKNLKSCTILFCSFLLLFSVTLLSAEELPNPAELLIDIVTTSTTPTNGQVFTYKIRYRYASTTEHGTNARVQLTFPNAYDIVNTPLIGGNVSGVTNSGSQYTVSLASPSSLGLPSGTLAAGASGLFEFQVKFKCGTNGSGGIPAAGTTVNLTQNPVFTVSGVSNTAAAPSAVTVPTVTTCTPAPSGSNNNSFGKYPNPNTMSPGMYLYWQLEIPEATSSYTYTDIFPAGFKLWEAPATWQNFEPGWTFEVQANGTWWNITNYGRISTWITGVANGGQLTDQNGTPIPGVTRVDVSMPNSAVYQPHYAENVTGIRFTTPSGGTPFNVLYIYTYTPLSTPTGFYQNCLSTTNPSWSPSCSNVYVTDRGSLGLECFFETGDKGLGGTTLSSTGGNYIPNNYPGLYKDPMDIQGTLSIPHFIKITSVEAPVVEVLLPEGFDFIEGSSTPNYWIINSLNLTTHNSPSALIPIFTKTPNYNGTGRTNLKWEFPNLVFSEDGLVHINHPMVYLFVYFSTRYVGTAPLPNNISANTSLTTSTVMTVLPYWLSNWGGPTQTVTCEMYYGVPTNGGSVNSEKWVEGALDVQRSRYPISGNTNLDGEAVYELYVHNHNFQPLKQIDIADILPYIGDKEMLGSSSRSSAWSEELSGSITVERYKAGIGELSASGYIPSGILYSNTYNACYLNGALPAGQATADPAAANTGQSAGCTDFSSGVAATGAKGFAFRWTQPSDPLLFGEYLKITVPVRQLTGQADMTNNEVAWNSFAYTAVENDGDVLFSSEPLKVGVKMIDMNTASNLCGTIWEDANGNGKRDGGENLISGVTVYLYNSSGQPVTDPVTINGITTNVQRTTITDTQGDYCFYGLNAITNYKLRLDKDADFVSSGPLGGFILTTANAVGISDTEDSDASLGVLAGSPTTPRPIIGVATSTSGTTVYNNDFGFYGLGTIGNFVWYDDDAAGDQDPSETEVQGVTMKLYTSANTLIATKITDANGRYLFEDILPGDYYILASTIPGGKVPTLKNAIGNNDKDSDFGSNLKTDVFNLGSNEDISYLDLGLRTPVTNPASICGRTWDDFDTDGIIDGTEPKMSNVTVQLLDATGFVLTTTTTDANGNYCFNNLTPNVTYKVGFVLPSPLASTFTNSGTDMDANTSTGITGNYTPIANQNITNVDCGFIGPFSIGNLVWSDTDNDGIKDAGESAYSGVKVYLLNSTGTVYLDSTITDSYGRYMFINLNVGSYKVEIELPTNTKSSTDVGTTPTPNGVDNDDNGIGTASSGRVQSGVITLQTGGGASGGANWLETDHGLVINGQTDPATNPKAYYTVDFGVKFSVPEVCGNGTDDDADGLTDCADPDCQYITFTNINSGTCINHPYADISVLSVTLSWLPSAPTTTIAVTIAGKTKYIDVAGGASSPQTLTFIVPADGSTNNSITAAFQGSTCVTTGSYNAAAPCSNDKLNCSMLYICGDYKDSDADAFDHGLMQYIDGINGNAILKAALSKNVAGQGLYNPNSPATLTPYDIDTFDIILVSATTWGQVSSTLKTQLKDTEANVLLLSQDILVDLAMASSQNYAYQSNGYSNNTTVVELYNFNNETPYYSPLIGYGNYHTVGDAYLWKDANNQASGIQGLFFHYTDSDVLAGVPATHGGRTFLGYMMDGVYWNNNTNMGAMPVPQAEWFDPIRHLTQAGKLYLDQAIQKAAIGCAVENCTNGIDDDGDGLIDCDDPNCQIAIPPSIIND